jgi:hypothetical protein
VDGVGCRGDDVSSLPRSKLAVFTNETPVTEKAIAFAYVAEEMPLPELTVEVEYLSALFYI